MSALGIAVAPMVTVAEILKNRGLAVEKKLCTSLESLSDDYRCTSPTLQQSRAPHSIAVNMYVEVCCTSESQA